MNKYMIKKIDFSNVKNFDEYMKEIENAIPIYKEGLEAVKNHSGTNIKKQRCGYSATKGNFEYIIERVK